MSLSVAVPRAADSPASANIATVHCMPSSSPGRRTTVAGRFNAFATVPPRFPGHPPTPHR